MRISRLVAVAVIICVSVVTTGCATHEAAQPSSSTTPAAPAVTLESLGTRHPTLVIGDDSGTTLCTGGVFQSLPPQCGGGIRLTGWDWDPWDGHYDQAGVVRWGEFSVTGTWDPDVDELAVTDALPAPRDAREPIEPPALTLETPCQEPEAGWPFISDPDQVLEAENLAAEVATGLAGFATLWVDSRWVGEPPTGSKPLEQLEHYARNAGRIVLNVGVHEDVAGAEERLRDVWPGALCVYEAVFVASQIQAIVKEITAEHPGASVGMDGVTGKVSATVLYDRADELQHELNARYGQDFVQVTSWLEPRR